MKKSTYIFVIGVLVILFFVVRSNKTKLAEVVSNEATPQTQLERLCFAASFPYGDQGFSDKYALTVIVEGEEAGGELLFVPAEKDSKTGVFSGVVSMSNIDSQERALSAFWETNGEGMKVTEELKITFTKDLAKIGFGEMVDRGDGVYVYSNAVDYSLELPMVVCDTGEVI